MRLRSLVWLAVIGAALLAVANARDIERYWKIRAM